MSKPGQHIPLSEIQSWMQQALVHSGATTERQDILTHIAPSPTLSAPERLAIYQRGYYARLIQCLEGQYKALCHALGKDLFDDFAREYLKLFPSQQPTLAILGQHFPDFLRQTRPDKDADEKETWIDFMIELAQLEWDLYTIFDAPGHEGRPYADATYADDSLALQPCFFLNAYDYPVGEYYSALARGEDPDVPEAQESYVAIVRKNFRTSIFTLLPPQYYFLKNLQEGKTLKEALAATALQFNTSIETATNAWSHWRPNWLEAGFFKHKSSQSSADSNSGSIHH